MVTLALALLLLSQTPQHRLFLQGTHAVGDGCEPTECVLGLGIQWLDGGAP